MVDPGSVAAAAVQRDRALRFRRSIVLATAFGASAAVGVVAGLAHASNPGHAAAASTGAPPASSTQTDPGTTPTDPASTDPSAAGGLQQPLQLPQRGFGGPPAQAVTGGS